MQGNLPVSFGKGATEKGWKVPRRCPTSFGGGRSEKGQRWYLVGPLPYLEYPFAQMLILAFTSLI